MTGDNQAIFIFKGGNEVITVVYQMLGSANQWRFPVMPGSELVNVVWDRPTGLITNYSSCAHA